MQRAKDISDLLHNGRESAEVTARDPGPLVEFKNVGVTYPGDIVALEHITLQIRKGDFVGLIGPNGAGKSTLLGVMVGIIKPSVGEVRLFGEPICSESLRHVGFVPQNPGARDRNFPATVYETVLMGRVPLSNRLPWFTRTDHEKAEGALRLLGIADLRNRSINELSGGQLQRVFTAKALASDPQLLIFDEPTSGADVKAKAEFYSILERLNKEMGITTILSLHDIGVVTQLARTIVCINKTLYFDGKTKDFDANKVISEAYGYPVEVVEHGDHP